jgi:prepilin-type N-terminal cleavage/methylation domain-containing protein
VPKVKKRFKKKSIRQGVLFERIRMEKKRKGGRKKGITLIELLLVVIILGALAALAIPRISSSATTAKQNTCATNVDIINSQMEMYYAEKGSYPTLVNLFADANYFPEGAPVCPVSATATYSLNARNRATCNH